MNEDDLDQDFTEFVNADIDTHAIEVCNAEYVKSGWRRSRTRWFEEYAETRGVHVFRITGRLSRRSAETGQ